MLVVEDGRARYWQRKSLPRQNGEGGFKLSKRRRAEISEAASLQSPHQHHDGLNREWLCKQIRQEQSLNQVSASAVMHAAELCSTETWLFFLRW